MHHASVHHIDQPYYFAAFPTQRKSKLKLKLKRIQIATLKSSAQDKDIFLTYIADCEELLSILTFPLHILAAQQPFPPKKAEKK